METKFNNLIKNIKKDIMTPEEKSILKNKIIFFVENYPISTPSPYIKKSPYFSRFSFAHVGKLVTAGAFMVVLGVGGLSYASADALPGDLLYPVKINLKEKIEDRLAFTPAVKLALRQRRIETRLGEVETLTENKLDNATSNTEELNIKIETAQISNDLAEVRKTNPEVALQADINIKNTIKFHREKINSLVAKEMLIGEPSTPTQIQVPQNTDLRTNPTLPSNVNQDTINIKTEIKKNMLVPRDIKIPMRNSEYYSSRILKSLPSEDVVADPLRTNQVIPEATPSNPTSPTIQIQKDGPVSETGTSL
jgi:hypothetical protein